MQKPKDSVINVERLEIKQETVGMVNKITMETEKNKATKKDTLQEGKEVHKVVTAEVQHIEDIVEAEVQVINEQGATSNTNHYTIHG